MKVYYLSSCKWETDFFVYDIFHGLEIDFVIINSSDMKSLVKEEQDIVVVLNHVLSVEDALDIVKRIQPIAIFHLSDELGGGMRRWLPLSKHTPLLFRQYNHGGYNIGDLGNVFQIPLGYMKGMLHGKYSLEINRVLPADRKYVWSFVGRLKADRKELCETFSKYFPGGFVSTSGKTNPHEMGGIYQQSVFVPNGRGHCSLDCFRLYEASIMGAIPVVVGKEEEIETTFFYNGDKPPFIYSSSWEEAVAMCQSYLQNPASLVEKQACILAWWERQVTNIHTKLRAQIRGSS